MGHISKRMPTEKKIRLNISNGGHNSYFTAISNISVMYENVQLKCESVINPWFQISTKSVSSPNFALYLTFISRIYCPVLAQLTTSTLLVDSRVDKLRNLLTMPHHTPLLPVQSPVPEDIDIAQSVPPQHVSSDPTTSHPLSRQ
jgi:hypothetical protein